MRSEKRRSYYKKVGNRTERIYRNDGMNRRLEQKIRTSSAKYLLTQYQSTEGTNRPPGHTPMKVLTHDMKQCTIKSLASGNITLFISRMVN